MPPTAAELLAVTTRGLAPDPQANPLVPLIADGAASRGTPAALALEQRWVTAADHRSFLHLAQRSAEQPQTAALFGFLAEGEELAGARLPAFAAACGLDEGRIRSHDPCRAARPTPPVSPGSRSTAHRPKRSSP
ncbi:hypothetical protein [Streptomyces sp. NPDC058964]|uniref:hypothetical protein n=1 Tax=Streptomyces sp. NPDC058964 TaxID=3346681 RepID=UPI0036AE78D1